MSGKTYVGDYGTALEVDTLTDLSDAIGVSILVRKPSGQEISWAATANGSVLRYVLQPGDLDMNGTWKIQAYIRTSGGEWRGDTVQWPVFSKFY